MKFYIFDETVFNILKSIRLIKNRIEIIEVLANNIFEYPYRYDQGSSYALDYRSINGLSPDNKIIFRILFEKCKSIASTTSKTENQKAFEMLSELDADSRYEITWALAKYYFSGSVTRLTVFQRLIFGELKDLFDRVINRHQKIIERSKKGAAARWKREKAELKPLNDGVIHQKMPSDAYGMPTECLSNAYECQSGFPFIKGSTPPKLNSSYKESLVVLLRVREKAAAFPNFEKFFRMYPSGHRRNKLKALKIWNENQLELNERANSILRILRNDIISSQWSENRYIPNIVNYLRKKVPMWPKQTDLDLVRGRWLPNA